MATNRDMALVTGASSGIGLEIARVLAERNVDLVITARRFERLAAVKEELESRFGVQVDIIEHDLAVRGAAESLIEKTKALGRPISILVNNAGFGTSTPMIDQPLDDIYAMVELNVVVVTALSRLMAEQMRERGRGYILNVASYAAFQPMPGMAVYSATKAFVLAMSETLRYELRHSGVRVCALCPGFTVTEFDETANWSVSRLMRLTRLKPDYVARVAVRGMLRGKAVVIPGWYKIAALLTRLQPRPMNMRTAAWFSGSN